MKFNVILTNCWRNLHNVNVQIDKKFNKCSIYVQYVNDFLNGINDILNDPDVATKAHFLDDAETTLVKILNTFNFDKNIHMLAAIERMLNLSSDWISFPNSNSQSTSSLATNLIESAGLHINGSPLSKNIKIALFQTMVNISIRMRNPHLNKILELIQNPQLYGSNPQEIILQTELQKIISDIILGIIQKTGLTQEILSNIITILQSGKLIVEHQDPLEPLQQLMLNRPNITSQKEFDSVVKTATKNYSAYTLNVCGQELRNRVDEESKDIVDTAVCLFTSKYWALPKVENSTSKNWYMPSDIKIHIFSFLFGEQLRFFAKENISKVKCSTITNYYEQIIKNSVSIKEIVNIVNYVDCIVKLLQKAEANEKVDNKNYSLCYIITNAALNTIKQGKDCQSNFLLNNQPIMDFPKSFYDKLEKYVGKPQQWLLDTSANERFLEDLKKHCDYIENNKLLTQEELQQLKQHEHRFERCEC